MLKIDERSTRNALLVVGPSVTATWRFYHVFTKPCKYHDLVNEASCKIHELPRVANRAIALFFISESPQTMPAIYDFSIFFPSFPPDVHGDIAKVAVHVFITMIWHHHLIICVLLLPYSSAFPRSSAAVATLVSYWFSIFVSKVHFFQQEIYVCLQRFVFQTII